MRKPKKLYAFVLLVVAVILVTLYKSTNQTDFQVTIDTSTLKMFESKNITIAVTKEQQTPRTTTIGKPWQILQPKPIQLLEPKLRDQSTSQPLKPNLRELLEPTTSQPLEPKLRDQSISQPLKPKLRELLEPTTSQHLKPKFRELLEPTTSQPLKLKLGESFESGCLKQQVP